MKFDVQIFGEIPSQIEIEADDQQQAIEKAIQCVLDELDIHAEKIQTRQPVKHQRRPDSGLRRRKSDTEESRGKDGEDSSVQR